MLLEYLDKNQRSKLFIVLVLAVLFFLIIFIVSIFLSSLPKDKQVTIKNLTSCTNNISETSKEALQTSLYDLVLEQNKINSLSSENNYSATIRDGSCSSTSNEDGGFSTNIILDIESLSYSYEIKFFWASTKTTEFTQNTPLFYCLDDNQMIYEPFACEKNSYISEKEDPLFSLLPYFNEDYEIKTIPSGSTESGYAALIVYYPCHKDSCKTKEELKKDAENYLKNNGINLDNYIIYEKDYIINSY